MDDKRIEEIVKHISIFQNGCEKFLSPLCNPTNKKVLVIGSGWGTEIAWLLSKKPQEIIGIDPAPRSEIPLKKYLEIHNLKGKYEIIEGTTEDIIKDKEHYFDLILSHNVFEHIMDLKAVFEHIPKLLSTTGRVAIFTDPLYYSSCGAHMNIKPWEHLWGDLDSIKEKVPAYQWSDYEHGLNKMTVSSFLKEVNDSGAIISQFYLKPDRNINEYPLYKEKLKDISGISPFDLTTEGISIEFFYNADQNQPIRLIENEWGELQKLRLEVKTLKESLSKPNKQKVSSRTSLQLFLRKLFS